MQHIFYDREDGLQHCKVCNGGEGSLPTDCPGTKMTAWQDEAVYAGSLNFAGGVWVTTTPNYDLPATVQESYAAGFNECMRLVHAAGLISANDKRRKQTYSVAELEDAVDTFTCGRRTPLTGTLEERIGKCAVIIGYPMMVPEAERLITVAYFHLCTKGSLQAIDRIDKAVTA